MLKKGIWIWENTQPKADEYADFTDSFLYEGGSVQLRISADSNYAVFVNEQLAGFGQYADFPHCKVADTHDIKPFCRHGRNALTIIVWYYGIASSVYLPGKAGLLYEITAGDAIVAASGTQTLCRRDPHYLSHRSKMITEQLGQSFYYNAIAADSPWHNAVATGYAPALHSRPVDFLMLEDLRPGKIIGGNESTHFLLDLGREEVGFLELYLESQTQQTILIAYGEYLTEAGVPRLIPYGTHLGEGENPMLYGTRDFSVEYGTVPGENRYMNPFRRLGCRYLEVFCEKPIRLYDIGIRPTMYPVTEIPFDAGSARRQQIYDTAVRTLRLCMHEHYEDCPWREQALYTMDSRNQMLCGYHAFAGTDYQRANLWLMAQDNREDGFLSICVPSGTDLVIPSFCLHWYQAVLEYTCYSGDLTLVQEIWDKLCNLLHTFCQYFDAQRGLLPIIPGAQYWNFYEWSGSFLMGNDQLPGSVDLILNCLFLRTIDTMRTLAEMTGLPFDLSEMAEPLRQQIRNTFRRHDGLYYTDTEKTHISQLGCALAVLTGVADEADAKVICQVLAGEDPGFPVKEIPIDFCNLTNVSDRIPYGDDTPWVTPASFSMSAFVYDALLQVDRDRYKNFVLTDIDSRCGYMLNQGATTFWETMGGWRSFENAGSLCHGWSAMAVYYYHTLL